jgi:Domain of unknown function (DUF5060)
LELTRDYDWKLNPNFIHESQRVPNDNTQQRHQSGGRRRLKKMMLPFAPFIVLLGILASSYHVFGAEITGFTLINAASNERVAAVRDGTSIDLATTGRELTLVANIGGAESGGGGGSDRGDMPLFVRLEFDSVYELDEYFPPYSLGGDQDGNFNSVSALSAPGQHTISATIFDSSGEDVDSMTVSFSVVESSSLLGFTLVDVSSGLDVCQLINGTVVDLFVSGRSLTIRVDTTDYMSDLDIKLVHQTSQPVLRRQQPYTLGGQKENSASLVEVPALSVPGNHKVAAYVLDNTGDVVESLSVQFNVLDRPFYRPDGAVTGELRTWHKVTIGFEGPQTGESAEPNPFTYYRLDMLLSHSDSRKTFKVPGYYAADGKAAHTGATSGQVWFVHFIPHDTGTWTWIASFQQGENVAQGGAGKSAGYFDGATGSFEVLATNKSGRDLRGKGVLRHVEGKHHLQFAGNGEWFLKVGADSPENFLAYDDFSKTPDNGGRRKSWNPHKQDFNRGDPTWAGGKGTGIIGAVNYLADQGILAFSFLTMSINGDDKNVFPFVSPSDLLRFDVSKTAQWEIVFEHADHKGMFLHFKTQETENDQLLDGGTLGLERRLYYRELIARFGHHLALNWNLGEETTNTVQQQKLFADYIRTVDPYNHPIVVHTFPNEQQKVYGPLYGYPRIDGASIQTDTSLVFRNTLSRVTASANAGHPWVVSNDEQGNAETGVLPDSFDPQHDEIRRDVLWGNIMVSIPVQALRLM